MRTYKPISSIIYSDKSFLSNRLKDSPYFDFWAFIEHEGEPPMSDFSSGFDLVVPEKKHIHFYGVPSGTIDTDILVNDVEHGFSVLEPERHKICVRIQKSKSFIDWLLYSIHDRPYPTF